MLLITLFAFATVFLLVFALLSPSQSAVQQRLQAYGYATDHLPGGDLSQPFARRVLWPVLSGLIGVIEALLPTKSWERTEQRLREAGLASRLSTGSFMLIRVLLGAGLPMLMIGPALMLGKPLALSQIGIGAVLAVVGWKLPVSWVNLKIDGRRTTIQKALPDALDLIVVCVEAGYALEAAIARVSEFREGPLADELARTLREISLGKPRREALRDLAKRVSVNDLQSFVAAIVQADQMGVSIADTLRIQADAMRVRRQQRAEEAAAKTPVKMLFPLATMIFPALFVVILGPAGLQIAQMFSMMGGR